MLGRVAAQDPIVSAVPLGQVAPEIAADVVFIFDGKDDRRLEYRVDLGRYVDAATS